MMKKLMQNTAVAAGFAALLLAGACASTNAVATEPTDEVIQVTETETVVSTPAPTVDADGNVIAEPATVSESTVTVTNSPLVEPGTMVDATATPLTTTTTTTTTTVATPAPMMSSSTLVDTQTTTATTDDTTATTETETRTRLRKD